jgi:hypothetical protein
LNLQNYFCQLAIPYHLPYQMAVTTFTPWCPTAMLSGRIGDNNNRFRKQIFGASLMGNELYSVSWHGAMHELARRASAEVERLDRRNFSDPSLGGVLERIVEKYLLGIAEIDEKGVHAERKETEIWVNDYGDRRQVKQKRLTVFIPFSGNRDSLCIQPTTMTLPNERVELKTDHVQMEILDDDYAKSKVLTLIAQLKQNLQNLTNDARSLKPLLEQAVSAMAENRKKQIAAETERDSKLGFPVTNR